jgi:integrase/recombinase XerD
VVFKVNLDEPYVLKNTPLNTILWEVFYMDILKMKRNVSMTVQDGFERFIRIKKANNVSKETIIYYDRGFKYFSEFFDVSQNCDTITPDTYYDYIEHLHKTRTVNSITLNTYLGALRTLFYFFMEEEYMKRFSIKLLKKEKKIKETYTDEELNRVLAKPNLKTCTFAEYRNWTMTNYFLGTGNRLRTTINVKVGHIDFENSLIFMGKTKNGKQQLIPMSKTLSEILQEYLIYRKGTADDYLFCSSRGKQLTRDGTSTNIRKYNLSRGITTTSIHAYRHTFAKKWILNGGDIFRLQKILGHSSMDMVKNYVEMFSDDLQKDFDVFNPLENLSQNKGKLIKM